MNTNEKTAFTLLRTRYYQDCTLGQLIDARNTLICQTMEPTCDAKSNNIRLAQPDGLYPLEYVYDEELNRHCIRLCRTKGRGCVRFYMHPFDVSEPKNVGFDILVGMRVDESEGRLDDTLSAFDAIDLIYRRKPKVKTRYYVRIISLAKGEIPKTNFSKTIDTELEEPDFFDYE